MEGGKHQCCVFWTLFHLKRNEAQSYRLVNEKIYFEPTKTVFVVFLSCEVYFCPPPIFLLPSFWGRVGR